MKKNKIMAFGFTILLSCSLMSCGQDDHAQNEMQEESIEPTARREAYGRGLEPSSSVAKEDDASLSHTDPDVGGHEMMPTQLITENITSGINLTTFASIIRHAEVVKELSSPGPYTVFVPSNDAFEGLPDNTLEDLMKPENKQRLMQVVNNHVVAGALSAKDLQNGAMLKTVGGAELKVTNRNNVVTVNGAEVVEANIVSENGVLHVINKVMVPKQ